MAVTGETIRKLTRKEERLDKSKRADFSLIGERLRSFLTPALLWSELTGVTGANR